MTSWIDHTERYITSDFKDRSAWDAAQSACQNPRICEFLSELPLKSEEAVNKAVILAESLEAERQEVPALMVRFLTYLPTFLNLKSPLQIPHSQRESKFNFAQDISNQIGKHSELLASAGFLCSVRGLGMNKLKQYSAARTSYEEARDIYRQLAAKEPDAYLPNVASALNDLGNLLSDMRDFPAARGACEEARDIYRQLAAKEPDAYLPNVASALNNLGNLLRGVRNFPEAREAYEEAKDIYRQLAAKESAAYLPNVAITLNNLGVLLRDVRDFSAARTAYEEALKIRRQLAAKEPDAYLPYVATTLNNLGTLLQDVSDFSAARTVFEEARDIYSQLAAKEPDAYLPYVATTLNNLGTLLRDVSDFSAARTAYEEARDIYRQLAVKEPDAYLPDMTTILNNLGVLLRDVLDFPAARTAFEETLEIRRQLAAKESAAYLPSVASTLNGLGNLLRDMRDFPAARTAFEETLEIRRQLAAKESASYLPSVASTLNNFGNLLSDMRDFPAARTAYEEARDIYSQLAAKEPDAYLPNVATTMNNLGNRLRDVRDFSAARTAYEEARDIYRQLAAKEPSAYLPGVAMTLNNLGGLLRDVRDIPAARTVYEEARDIYRQLATREPAAYLPNVAITLNNLGMLLSDVSDFPAARTAYEEAVELVEVMHRHDTLHHLAKNNVASAYQYLLADAAASCDIEKAFAYSVAMRDGQARSAAIGQGEMRATQDWLGRQSEHGGFFHRLLIPSNGSDGQLVLGLIDLEGCRFISLQSEVWKGLSPGYQTITNHLTRRQLARELWQSLPDAFQSVLAPTPGRKQFIAISGDPFWSAFPWELLRFGEGDEDYLGLHYALPRLGAIQAKDLQSQLSLTELGQGGGRISVLAPFDTGLLPLTGVVGEIESVKQTVEMRGGGVVAFAKGSDASDLEIERQIGLQPDIFYYSGHGTIIQEEELLVLHRDLSTQNTMSSTTYFGKEHLANLAERESGELFPQHPLIVLNSCLTGRARQAGGAREDLISTFLALGAGAVIATALPIYDVIGKALGEALFDPATARASDIASVVVGTRRRLAREVCADVESQFWGAWSMIHLHGNARATLPF